MNSSNLPPGCGTLPGEEPEQLDNRHLAEAFPDAESPAELYRQIYKYAACGPWLSVEVDRWKHTADGSELGTREVHCGELHELGTWADMDKRGDLVTALIVGSIVEGVDYGTDEHRLELDQLDEESEALAARFYKAVDEVNEEAESIWQDTHGCETCIAHFNGAESEFGGHPVWKDCPDCGGDGTVI